MNMESTIRARETHFIPVYWIGGKGETVFSSSHAKRLI